MAGGRGLTGGEQAMLQSVFASHIDYPSVQVYGRKWQFFQPDDTAMTPNGNIYFPPGHYLADYSLSSVPLGTRAWFVHEGAHLYQFYGLKWNVIARGMFSRDYSYELVKGKKLQEYGLEQMGSIAADYYVLVNHGTIKKKDALADYASALPLV
jgi:hypothetical protein